MGKQVWIARREHDGEHRGERAVHAATPQKNEHDEQHGRGHGREADHCEQPVVAIGWAREQCATTIQIAERQEFGIRTISSRVFPEPRVGFDEQQGEALEIVRERRMENRTRHVHRPCSRRYFPTPR
jgi:hypothetical protein